MTPNGTKKRFEVTNRTAFLIRKDRPWLSVLSVSTVLLIWELSARLGLVSPLFLPSPTSIFSDGWTMIVSGELFIHVGMSLWRILAGFFIGTVTGILIGLATGVYSSIDNAVSPLVSASYPIPKIALFPLLILWLGIGEESKIAVIALGVFFPLVINVHSGAKNADPQLIKAAVSLGASRLSVIIRVILPSTLPMIFAGLKLGIGIALLLVVTAEMVAADSGIGFMILSAADLMQTTRLMFGLAVLSLLGMIFAKLVNLLERKLIPWKDI